MPSQRNQNQLSQLKAKLARAKSVILADHSGLSVSQQSQLRTAVKQLGGEFTVAKNTLLRLALDLETADPSLRGPTAVLFSYEDELRPLKEMVRFAESHDNPTVKAGLLAGKPLTAAQVMELAQLPGFEGLITRLMAQLNGPMAGVVNVLAGNTSKLVLILRSIEQLEKGGET